MKLPGQVTARLLRIQWTLLRHGLDDFILSLHLFRPVRWLLYVLPWHWRRKSQLPHPVRIRLALEDLGPVFIKFGQMISTRRDLLPPEMADELALLQDRVAPYDGEAARAEIERALGKKVEEIYDNFDTKPLASGSVAQVHTAQLNGQDVVVKVLRPGVEHVIRRDVELMFVIARLAERYWPESRRMHPVDLVKEYENVIFNELDLSREAANASQLRRNFEHSDLMYIPEVFWDYTTQTVMTMERIYGIRISDRDALEAHGIDLKLLAERGVEVFFMQVFEHNFFHGDMHPGNIFVSQESPEMPQYSAVDFGIVGALSPFDQRYLALNFAAFFNRDYQRVAELHVECGWVPPETRVADFEAAIRTVCEPIFQRPFSEISFGHLLMRLFQTARRFRMEIQPQLALLQKTMLNIEGIGRDLDPDLDLWATAKPFIDQWVRQQVSWATITRTASQRLPQLLDRLLGGPSTSAPASTPQDDTLRLELKTTRRRLDRVRGWLTASITAALTLAGWLAYQHWNGGL